MPRSLERKHATNCRARDSVEGCGKLRECSVLLQTIHFIHVLLFCKRRVVEPWVKARAKAAIHGGSNQRSPLVIFGFGNLIESFALLFLASESCTL